MKGEALLPPYDARAVANYILELADHRRVNLTQMQILKIIYFAHGWYLAAYDKALIKQDFEAWKMGPVVRVVRDAFAKFGKDVVTERAESFDIFTGEIFEVLPVQDEKDRKFIKDIFSAYHIHDGWSLSQMTHEKDSPWDRLWNADEPRGRLRLALRNDEIRSHFLKLKELKPLSA